MGFLVLPQIQMTVKDKHFESVQDPESHNTAPGKKTSRTALESSRHVRIPEQSESSVSWTVYK